MGWFFWFGTIHVCRNLEHGRPNTKYRSILLPNAESENVSADSVFHLDAFLYDDELEQSLVDEGRISRAVCKKCGSRDTQPMSKCQS